ncbi:hypothetical protein Tco_0722438 [Tanacetum coccineum]
MNIIKNHPLRFSIAASASVPWIYMAQFWHTLKEDGSKHRLKFLLDRKELTLTLDDFRTIFHLPQANDKHSKLRCATHQSMSLIWSHYHNKCGDLNGTKTVSHFHDNLVFYSLGRRYARYSPINVGRHLLFASSSCHFDPILMKIIISHYMTIFPDISRRARDAYHNLQDDDIMKNIFNSGRNKNKVGMRIPAWMITDEMKLTEHYKMYAEVFGLDVPLTQSQPTESTQGMHRTPSSPRSPNPATETTESSVPKRSTVICFRLPSRQSAPLTPPVLVPSTKKANEMILQDMLQHLAAEEIEKLVEDPENVDDSSPPRHDDTSIPGTRLEPRSDKESLEVEIVQEKEEETNQGHRGKNVEETRISPIPSPTRSPRNLSTLVSSDTEKLQELTVTHPTPSLGKLYPLGEEESNKHVQKEVSCSEVEKLSSKRQKTSEYEAYVSRESSSGQANVEEPGPSTSVTQDIMEEISLTIDEAKLKKMADEMLRQRCTSRDEHQYHIDQMKNFLQRDFVFGTSRKKSFTPHPRKITPLVQSCQRDPEAPALSLINQDLLYLKKGNSGPEKIVLIAMVSISVHQEFSDMGKSARFSTWNQKLSTED